jgi:hypothetical protein
MSLRCVLTSNPAACVIMGLGLSIASCGEFGKGAGGATGGSASGAGGATSAGAGGNGTAGSGTGGSGTGGSSTAGSSSGGTGGGNPACVAAPYEHTFGFGALFEGWTISSFSTPSLVPTGGSGGSGGTGGSDAGGEGGDFPGGTGGASPTGTIMELDTSDGAPDSPNGSLKLTIPFDAPAQLLLLGQVYNTNLNFTGTLVTAWIKLDSGLSVGPSDTGRANLILKSTDGFIYNAGPAVVLDPSAGWTTLTLDPDAPSAEALSAGYNACQIREIDIEIRTGDTGNYRGAVVHIDAVAVAPKER